MIELQNIVKRFGSTTILDSINLEIREGEIHALLGTNGAGKSTLIKILAGLLPQDGGKIFYDNVLLERSIIRNIGFVFDEPLYLSYFSAREYLEFVCRLLGMEPKLYKARIDDMIALFNLPTDRQPISAYSNGMKSKVSFATAMIHSPKFLVLDEPFNGIDFITIREIIKILKQRAHSGAGILVTSHQFDIIAELATHFSILHDSRIVLSIPEEQLKDEAEKRFTNLPAGEAVKCYVENTILSL